MIKLSIICLAYNHGPYIRQALEGFVTQKTNFDFEVLIHDDASTDATADIIREYQQKYPHIIKPIFQTENQWSKKIGICKNFLYPNIKGKYVAFCEGDDYWTDENKLQKQVDFLDTHPDYAICFHPVTVKWEDGSNNHDEIFPKPRYRFYKKTLTLADLLKHNFIQTNSVVYRWCLQDNFDVLPDGIMPGDYFLHLIHAKTGKIGFLPDIMAVYRRHSDSVWFGAGYSDEFFIRNGRAHITFLHEVQKQFNVDKSANIHSTFIKTIAALLKKHDFKSLQMLCEKFPQYIPQISEDMLYLNSNLKYARKLDKYKKICIAVGCIYIIMSLFLIWYVL